jgi:hypothetical protein
MLWERESSMRLIALKNNDFDMIWMKDIGTDLIEMLFLVDRVLFLPFLSSDQF